MSIKTSVYLITGIFFTTCILLIGLSVFQTNTINAVRAYIQGEGLWAKGQKDAVIALQQYIYSGDNKDYNAYLAALDIPLGDKLARRALQSATPNRDAARNGFLQGQNHPDDIPSMIDFFLRFHDMPYVRDAIATWEQADKAIAQLIRLGNEIAAFHAAQNTNNTNRLGQRELLVTELNRLNHQLLIYEKEFSGHLSDGARWLQNIIFWLNLIILLLVIGPITLTAFWIIVGIKETEEKLSFSESRFKSLFDANLLGICDWDADGHLSHANRALCEMLGYSQEEVARGKVNWRAITPKEFREADEKALKEIGEKNHCQIFSKEFNRKNGERVLVLVGAVALNEEKNQGVCFFVDLSERKKAEEQLALSSVVFNATSNGIMLLNENFKLLSVNDAFSRLTGLAIEDIQHSDLFELLDENFSSQSETIIADTLNESELYKCDTELVTADGNSIPVQLNINRVLDSQGRILQYVAVAVDIRERVESEQKLRKIAHYDHLTGLPNRSLLSDRHNKAIARAKRLNTKVALLFFDLDNFKPVNDQHGHDVGDKLLVHVARRLKESIRESDTVARLGGDEFVILLEDVEGENDVAVVADKIVQRTSALFIIDELKLRLSCSIGISLFPEHGSTRVEMMRRADVAMYNAKKAGRNQYQYYREES